MQSPEDTNELIARLNGETAKIEWHQLQKHYATGSVVAVDKGFDLIKVAIALNQDDTEQVKQWLAEGKMSDMSNQQAQSWYDQNSLVWALVLPPFVLVQEVKAS
jgi:hypothetical protein